MRILVVEDGTQRGALAAVRSLGHAGYTVGVASPVRGHAARSRWCTRWHHVPPPARPTDLFAAAIGSSVAEHGYEIAFGVGDAEAIALSKHRDDIGCALGYPDHDVVEAAFDKVAMSRLAERLGIRVPASLDVRDPQLRFPVMVKERVHGPETAVETSTRVFASVAYDRAELDQAVRDIEERAGEVVVEEYVDGALEAVFLYAHEGRVFACGRSIADRVFPPSGGVSTRGATLPLDPALTAQVEDLIAELGWTGVAQLQFLRRLGDAPRFIDFNGRFYGSLSLAVDAGVDLPVLWVEAIMGRLPGEWKVAAPGVRYHWLEGDLRSALAEPPGRRWRETAVALAWSFRGAHSIWGSSDPGPAVHHFGVLLRRAMAKVMRWISRPSSTAP